MTGITPETLPAIIWQNKLVITTELLAQIYDTAVKNIRMNFANNIGRFSEGTHFFKLVGADLKAFKNYTNDIGLVQIAKNSPALYLWTERGTVRHAKILDTDNAWLIQDRLEDSYFAKNTLTDLTPYSRISKKISPEQQQEISIHLVCNKPRS